jgi:KUP system potassium uptake protein
MTTSPGMAAAEPGSAAAAKASSATRRRLAALTLGSIGVVYGDIGTSPLYAVRACFDQSGVSLTPAAIFGLLSLIFWSLTIVVTLKYLVLVLRADNRGEGGILALMALVAGPEDRPNRWRPAIVTLGLFGAALLYGDGAITPAISILSAVEGLGVATHVFEGAIEPIAIGILVALFAVQYRGTSAVGSVFGPVMVMWFVVIGALGVVEVVRQPGVLAAVNPVHAVRFLLTHRLASLGVLGGVFLTVTGAEALYADMGHFGRAPIRLGWAGLVFPMLVLNYFGQGALLIADPSAIVNPFYRLAPPWALYPLVVLATAATVVASQAMISGAYSLTSQAVSLGYLPRVRVLHTSMAERGQVYVPVVTSLLLAAAVALVLVFGSSGALAGAYGLAVSLTMLITSLLTIECARQRWGWSVFHVALVIGSLLVVDVVFIAGNMPKLIEGGWVAVAGGLAVYLLMSTWRQGRTALASQLKEGALTPDGLLAELARGTIGRVPGTAVYMTRDTAAVPRVLLHNLKHNRVLHEQIVLLSIVTEDVPRVSGSGRITLEHLAPDVVRLIARIGFMETPDVPRMLEAAVPLGLQVTPLATTYVLGRETIIPRGRPGLRRWRGKLFALMHHAAAASPPHFRIPPNQVIEIGSQIDL